MTNHDSISLDEDERAAFLEPGGTGVLSFATGVDQPPYSLPVSYGYDRASGTFFLRLGVVPDGEKLDYVAEDRPVSLVVHGETADSWHSVVATGHLKEVTESAIGSAARQGLQRVEIPLFEVFDRPTDEVEFRFVRLDPAEITGRREAPPSA
jgi:nitroimidazol reductase NimA-like FMN-containing flavoprotein (pyridoxamine 5'-phosphate oxidase superfamily)